MALRKQLLKDKAAQQDRIRDSIARAESRLKKAGEQPDDA
jgi:hypothetical protein